MSAIVCPSRYILTAGWNRVVRVYSDLPGHDEEGTGVGGRGGCADCLAQWTLAHNEDILCMTLLRPTTVVTASYDGDLVVWSLDNGQTVARFNAELDTGPLRSKPHTVAFKTAAARRRSRRTTVRACVYKPRFHLSRHDKLSIAYAFWRRKSRVVS